MSEQSSEPASGKPAVPTPEQRADKLMADRIERARQGDGSALRGLIVVAICEAVSAERERAATVTEKTLCCCATTDEKIRVGQALAIAAARIRRGDV